MGWWWNKPPLKSPRSTCGKTSSDSEELLLSSNKFCLSISKKDRLRAFIPAYCFYLLLLSRVLIQLFENSGKMSSLPLHVISLGWSTTCMMMISGVSGFVNYSSWGTRLLLQLMVSSFLMIDWSWIRWRWSIFWHC